MNLQELIEEHGPIVAAQPDVGIVVCWDHENAVLTVCKDEGMNGDYSMTEQYDLEGDNTPDNAESEALDVLDDVLGDESGESEGE